MVHEKVSGSPLPGENLLFEGSTYDLGWDGRRTSASSDDVALPTTDYALFLINAVKFHCGQLFHLFDEQVFMRHFSNFHENLGAEADSDDLWYVHYLMILALGKAFVMRVRKERRPPGADLFVQAMRLLPDITYLCTKPFQSMEVLCCAALYLQCVDMRVAAYNLVSSMLPLVVVDVYLLHRSARLCVWRLQRDYIPI
jgi:proline utilization trans-activator